MFIRIDPDAWHPSGGDRKSTTRIKPGMIVVWQRKPYRLVEIRERAHHDWPEEYRQGWAEHGMPDPATWYYRPMVVVIRDVDNEQAKPQHLLAPASHYWDTLPEHYSICRLCGELPPCNEVHTERVMARAQERMEEEMAILPGCCHACREPITKRQKSISFAGPNLIRPDLGDGSAIFHLRSGCYREAQSYDERWAKHTGSKRRMYCAGHQSIHIDGSKDCTELAECVGADVDHQSREWHHPEHRLRPNLGVTCWCLAGDLSGRITEVPPASSGSPESLF
jgi:hypothetical protein